MPTDFDALDASPPDEPHAPQPDPDFVQRTTEDYIERYVERAVPEGDLRRTIHVQSRAEAEDLICDRFPGALAEIAIDLLNRLIDVPGLAEAEERELIRDALTRIFAIFHTDPAAS